MRKMPLKGEKLYLSDYCGAPAGSCVSAGENCDKRKDTIHKELALKRRQEGRKVADEIKPPGS